MRCLMCALMMTMLLMGSGCVHPVDFKSPAAISSAFIVKRDDYYGTTNITGPDFKTEYGTVFMFSSKNDRIGHTSNKISVDTYYHGDKRYYDKANDLDGNNLDLMPTLAKVDYCDNSGCWNEEKFDITVTREYLQKNQDNGIAFKVSGNSNYYQTFTLPSAYIKAYLAIVK